MKKRKPMARNMRKTLSFFLTFIICQILILACGSDPSKAGFEKQIQLSIGKLSLSTDNGLYKLDENGDYTLSELSITVLDDHTLLYKKQFFAQTDTLSDNIIISVPNEKDVVIYLEGHGKQILNDELPQTIDAETKNGGKTTVYFQKLGNLSQENISVVGSLKILKSDISNEPKEIIFFPAAMVSISVFLPKSFDPLSSEKSCAFDLEFIPVGESASLLNDNISSARKNDSLLKHRLSLSEHQTSFLLPSSSPSSDGKYKLNVQWEKSTSNDCSSYAILRNPLLSPHYHILTGRNHHIPLAVTEKKQIYEYHLSHETPTILDKEIITISSVPSTNRDSVGIETPQLIIANLPFFGIQGFHENQQCLQPLAVKVKTPILQAEKYLSQLDFTSEPLSQLKNCNILAAIAFPENINPQSFFVPIGVKAFIPENKLIAGISDSVDIVIPINAQSILSGLSDNNNTSYNTITHFIDEKNFPFASDTLYSHIYAAKIKKNLTNYTIEEPATEALSLSESYFSDNDFPYMKQRNLLAFPYDIKYGLNLFAIIPLADMPQTPFMQTWIGTADGDWEKHTKTGAFINIIGQSFQPQSDIAYNIVVGLKNSKEEFVNNLTKSQILNIAEYPFTITFQPKRIFLSKAAEPPEILAILSQANKYSAWLSDQAVDISFDTSLSEQTKIIELMLFDAQNHENHGLAQITITP